MKRFYDFTVYIGITVIPIFVFRYIVLGIGLSIEYDETSEHSYLENSSLYHWIILSVISLFFLFIWYEGINYFFPNLYKYKIDKKNKEELSRIRRQFKETSNYELNDIIFKSRRLSILPISVNDEKDNFVNDAYIEKGRREFEERYQELKNKLLEFVILLFIGFSLGYLWIK